MPCRAVLCWALQHSSDADTSLLQRLMIDPVIAADGHTYERGAVQQWLQQHDASPVTHLLLPHKRLLPNVLIKSATANHQQQQQPVT